MYKYGMMAKMWRVEDSPKGYSDISEEHQIESKVIGLQARIQYFGQGGPAEF